MNRPTREEVERPTMRQMNDLLEHFDAFYEDSWEPEDVQILQMTYQIMNLLNECEAKDKRIKELEGYIEENTARYSRS